jgi:dethiobiotin synthetase
MSCFFITGIDTDVGKTVVTAILTAYFKKQGKNVHPYKPIQSGGINLDGKLVALDTQVYRLALPDIKGEDANTYLFKRPSSPHFAAREEGIEIFSSEIINQVHYLKKKYEMVLIEGAGGLMVPLKSNGYTIMQLIQELSVPVILVAHTGVGTINHTVLSVMAMREAGITIAGIVLNRIKEEEQIVEQDNKMMIEKLTNVPVIGMIPYIKNVEEMFQSEIVLDEVFNTLQLDKLKEPDNQVITEKYAPDTK